MTATMISRSDELWMRSYPRELGSESSQAAFRAPGGSAVRPEPPPLAVMIHLLGAVALGAASLALGALVILGVVEQAAPGVLAVVLGSSSAVIWLAWLVRITVGAVRDDEDRHGPAGDTGPTPHPRGRDGFAVADPTARA